MLEYFIHSRSDEKFDPLNLELKSVTFTSDKSKQTL